MSDMVKCNLTRVGLYSNVFIIILMYINIGLVILVQPPEYQASSVHEAVSLDRPRLVGLRPSLI